MRLEKRLWESERRLGVEVIVAVLTTRKMVIGLAAAVVFCVSALIFDRAKSSKVWAPAYVVSLLALVFEFGRAVIAGAFAYAVGIAVVFVCLLQAALFAE